MICIVQCLNLIGYGMGFDQTEFVEFIGKLFNVRRIKYSFCCVIHIIEGVIDSSNQFIGHLMIGKFDCVFYVCNAWLKSAS